MRVNSKEKLFGHPVLKIREIIRYAMNKKLWARSETGIYHKASGFFKISESTSKEIINKLINNGYLKIKKEKAGSRIQYELVPTAKGNRLGNASALPPITTGKATQLLSDLIERAKSINENDDLVYYIESLKVFGSYLSDTEVLSDLDVGFKLSRRYEGDQFMERNQKRIDLALNKGKSFRNFVDEVTWPHTEVIKMLKAGKRYINLHNEEEDDVLKVTDYEIVYQFDKSVQLNKK
ncbi:MAG: hypothetical protein U5Q03_18935 [Bacteroidota bacterium]|nr:hypothetical protein [Bacteroidota bacterium]